MSVTIAIDPGAASGAIACFVDGQLLDAIDMPCVERTIQRKGKPRTQRIIAPALLVDEFRQFALAGLDDRPTIIVERVHSMPTDGSTQAFGFGRSLGVIEGVTAGLGWPLVWVTPQLWQAHHGLIGEDKDAARLLALETWPTHAATFKFKKDHGRADAALIAQWHKETTS